MAHPYNRLVTIIGSAFLLFASSLPLAAQSNGAIDETATASANSPVAKAVPQLQQRNPRYTLRAGDVLDMSFPFTPELNATVNVQPDGYITLRGVGDCHVAGLTLPQLRDEVTKKYSTILASPEINIELKDFEKPYFVAGGEVAKPGKYDMRGDTTLNEAVQMAGGFTSSARHSQVILMRRLANSEVEVKKVNVKRLLATGALNEDIRLQPGDVIFVPKNQISKLKDWIPKPSLGAGYRF